MLIRQFTLAQHPFTLPTPTLQGAEALARHVIQSSLRTDILPAPRVEDLNAGITLVCIEKSLFVEVYPRTGSWESVRIDLNPWGLLHEYCTRVLHSALSTPDTWEKVVDSNTLNNFPEIQLAWGYNSTHVHIRFRARCAGTNFSVDIVFTGPQDQVLPEGLVHKLCCAESVATDTDVYAGQVVLRFNRRPS